MLKTWMRILRAVNQFTFPLSFIVYWRVYWKDNEALTVNKGAKTLQHGLNLQDVSSFFFFFTPSWKRDSLSTFRVKIFQAMKRKNINSVPWLNGRTAFKERKVREEDKATAKMH